MLTILFSLLCGLAVGVGFQVSHVFHSMAGAITPAVIVTLVVAILLLRRVGKKINPVVEEAQRHVGAGRRELALTTLRSGLRFRAWHPFIAGQLRAQLGALLYDGGDLDAATVELKHASSRPWESQALLGCAYFKKRDEKLMEGAFERAVAVGAKDGLSWTVYAWCMLARGKRDEALKLLTRGLKKASGDARLKANLELVTEGKKMKVAPYGDRWSRFQLDGSKPGVPRQMRGFAQRPGFRQRPIRKGG